MRLLDVKPATLYAYVSRGLVRSVPGGKRARLYAREDLERLRARHVARSGHGPVAAAALRWGEPVLDSAVSFINDGGLHYRGQSAVALASLGATFESVAELLWNGTEPAGQRWAPTKPPIDLARLASLLAGDRHPLLALQLAVPALAAVDPGRFDTRREAEIARARQLVPWLAVCVAAAHNLGALPQVVEEDTVAGAIFRALGKGDSPVPHASTAISAIEKAMILSADHELNVSAFVARVTASSGADLYACIAAAVAALSGPRHGGECDRVEAIVAEIGTPDRAANVVRERMRRGDTISGFGHPLYSSGDPRARAMLDIATDIAPDAASVRTVVAFCDAMFEARREYPTLDCGLVAVAGALGLGPGAAAAIFAVGRSAGWIAHVLEQRQSDVLIRPRARYVGPAVSAAPPISD